MSEIARRLSSAPRSDLRALDRVCEEVAAELIATGTTPDFVISSDFATDAFLICADRYWRRRFLAEPSLDTAVQCALWLAEHAEPEHRRMIEERWGLGFGFVTSDSVDTDTAVEAVTVQIEQRGEQAADVAYFACLYQAGKLRTNFAFRQLYRLLAYSRLAQAAAHRRTEPVLTALRSMAAFGDRTYTPDHALDLMREAWTHPSRGRAAVDVCLNGLANSRPFPGQGEVLVEHARQAIAEYPDDHGMHYWLAIGHQLSGNYEEAGTAIDDALHLLPAHGSRGSHGLLLEQYRQRRMAIHDHHRLARPPKAVENGPGTEAGRDGGEEVRPSTGLPSRWLAVKWAAAALPIVLLSALLGQLVGPSTGSRRAVVAVAAVAAAGATVAWLRFLAKQRDRSQVRRSR
ncbi:hypothetical protein [Streptomyces sp. JJ38]|uniref:hypothetical protein n=1 Tax=Streptomyces sp. JJ38 TaxID=2738128 RepID=UPI001C587E02|nr:hypothetical protein [Streptomyces sp. JJ38]MBW1597260.1 hypothetical protein [Streptomyces sp. JJ38]